MKHTTTRHEQKGRTHFTTTAIAYGEDQTAEVTTTYTQYPGCRDIYEVSAWIKHPESRALAIFVTPTGERVPAFRKVHEADEATTIHAALVAEFTAR